MLINLTLAIPIGYPWVSKTRRVVNPWRQGGSYYGEGARGDRREGGGGSTTASGETALVSVVLIKPVHEPMTVPNPKDEKLNAPLPYEFQFAQSPTPMPQLTSQYPTLQYLTQYQQVQQAQSHQKEELKEREMGKIRKKVIIGVILLMIPIINLVGVALLVDALIHYLKLRSR